MPEHGESRYEEGSDQPQVGSDPMEEPQNEPRRETVAPDPDKVEEAERHRRRREKDASPEERAERIKNA